MRVDQMETSIFFELGSTKLFKQLLQDTKIKPSHDEQGYGRDSSVTGLAWSKGSQTRSRA